MAEAGAKAAVAALKDATLIKSKKADWRLVAAAQAMLRGEHQMSSPRLRRWESR